MAAENEKDKTAEIDNAITGDFLTEKIERAYNDPKGPGIPSLYKKSTPPMKQAVYDYQARQREEHKVHRFTILHILVSINRNI